MDCDWRQWILQNAFCVNILLNVIIYYSTTHIASGPKYSDTETKANRTNLLIVKKGSYLHCSYKYCICGLRNYECPVTSSGLLKLTKPQFSQPLKQTTVLFHRRNRNTETNTVGSKPSQFALAFRRSTKPTQGSLKNVLGVFCPKHRYHTTSIMQP